jgi:hypothetical protein
VKGWVFDFYLRKPAVGVGEKDVGDFAAMPLGEGDGERVSGQFFGRILWFRGGKIIELLEDELNELNGVVDFQRAEFGPGINVA